ncbi:hypothetical protein RhiirA1_398516 [Rhizophagus irregularis]|uniref:Uncharacterized protein n=1 Tax=Rhizophagus irregularis TaxID=588596 RepID=A0A2N0RDD7_9GLOM|nr:hypothetical protein RhiirA1_398516 [Rhizophagus irregularis]CAB4489763.1 unnamed protein product [Rhizophagus irregularis]
MDKPTVTVCKQLDVHQEKLHEGTSHSKLLPQRPEQQEEETALLTEEKHLIHMKDDLWRHRCLSIGCGRQMEKLSPVSSYILDRIRKCRIQRQLKSNTSRLNFIRQIRQLPRQNTTTNLFEFQFFNGTDFY